MYWCKFVCCFMWSKSFCALRVAKVQKFSFELTPATKILFSSSFIRTKKATLKITSPRLRGDSLGGTRKSPDQVLPYGRGGFRRGDRTLCLRTKALKTRKATLNGCQRVRFSGFYVRIKGLEPPRLSASDPKSDVATNYTISAWLCAQRYEIFFESSNGGRFIQSATSLQV